MSDLKTRSLNAAAWSTGAQLLKTIITFVVFVILARPLGPAEFGLLGMVTVITNFAMVFTDSGFINALIQKQDLEETHISSVFWFNLGIGVVLAAIFFLGAPVIGEFYDRPPLIPLTRFVSICFIIWSLHLVQKALLIRDLEFRQLALCELAARVAAGATAIVLAYLNFGVWSLAVQAVLLPLALTVLLWHFSKWRPAFLFRVSAIRELLQFSLNLLGTNILNYWVRNLDNLLIGKFLGETLLGFYNRAYNVMMIPINNLSGSISRVLFPSLARIQHQPHKVKQVFLSVVRVIGFLAYPAIFGLVAIAPHFVEVMLGPKWLPMTTVLRILCVVSAIQCTSYLIGNLYLSQGRTDLQFRVTFILRLNLIAGIVIGLYWGIEGVATGYLLAVVLNQFPNMYFAGKLVGLRFSEYLKALAGNLGCAGGMALIVFFLGWYLDQRVPVWLALFLEVAAGIPLYLLLARIFDLRSMAESLQVIRQVAPRLAPRSKKATAG